MSVNDTEPDVELRYKWVKGERIDDGQYRLRGLPEGADFRDESDWDTVECGWLKVSGVGFSASAFEFSEHETYIDVTQPNEGGGTYITFTDM